MLQAIKSNVRKFAAEVMMQEYEAIRRCQSLLDKQFDHAVDLILKCSCNEIVSGVGKCGLIGQKLSSTFASTGTPSHFVHATEALIGDLGRISEEDIVILLSNSGTTDEVIALAAILWQDQVDIISVTGEAESQLGRLSNVVLSIGSAPEACPHNLAPTASTAAMLAIGDALALTVSNSRPFSADDFHKRHPAGAIGKKMLPVRDVLRFRVGKNTAVVAQQAILRDMLDIAEQYSRRCGAVLVVDEKCRLTGIVTDSDLRRLLITEGAKVLNQNVDAKMSHNPVHVSETDFVKDICSTCSRTSIGRNSGR